MKKYFIAAIAALALPLMASAQQETIQPKLLHGLPDGFTTENLNGSRVNTSIFSSSKQPEAAWYVTRVTPDNGNASEAALVSCAVRTGDATEVDNLLVFPQLKVVKGSMLRWKAKSLHFELRDSYMVMISTDGTNLADFKPLMEIKDETYLWDYHFVDLSEYEGKNIYIALRHTSDNGFMLAVADVLAGVPTEPLLVGRNIGTHFVTGDDDDVCFSVTNYGAPIEVARFKITDEDGNLLAEMPMTDALIPLSSGESIEYSTSFLNGENKAVNYSLWADNTELYRDVVSRNRYPRKLFMEKFTGAWCNGCTRAVHLANYVNEVLGDEVVALEIHHPGSIGYDTFGYLDYYNTDVFYKVCSEVPKLWFDRRFSNSEYQMTDLGPYKKALETTADAGIRLWIRPDAANGTIDLYSESEFSEPTDNSGDKYRLGYVIAQKHPKHNEKPVLQSNAIAGNDAAQGEFTFLDSYISEDYAGYHDVVLGFDGIANGISGSFSKGALDASRPLVHEITYPLPERIGEDGWFEVAAVIMNTGTPTYEMLNADNVTFSMGAKATVNFPAEGLEINTAEELDLRKYVDPSVDVERWICDKNVATVDNGVLTPKAEGETEVVALCSNGQFGKTHVMVKQGSGVVSLASSSVRWAWQGDVLAVRNLPDRAMVRLYGVDGSLLAQTDATGSEAKLEADVRACFMLLEITGADGVTVLKIK